MKKVSQILGTVITFLTSTGFTWVGYGLGAVGVFVLMPKNWFWGTVFGILAGLFVMANLDKIKPWAVKQYKDLKSKF